MKQVNSSMISEVGYDPNTKDLEIVFKSGKKYVYSGVDLCVYEELIKASSVGQYFHSFIRGQYFYEEA